MLGEAALFGSLRLLAYAGVLAACFHLFVTGYEEPALRRRFGPAYLAYRHAVPRWIPRRPSGEGLLRGLPLSGLLLTSLYEGAGTTGAGKSRV